jgi:serine/threonine protein kinase
MPQQTPLVAGDPRRLGRYRLGGRIAGIPSEDPIFIGIDPAGAEVAISLLRGEWARDAAARDRFAAEAAVAKRVPPFCAARVLDAGQDPSGAYLVSEYIPGPSLMELVAADGVRRGHELDAVAIAMATGLASVHQAGLVHGNFGPEYVIMAADGPPRVVEFGITPPYGVATPSADMLAWAQTVVFAAVGHPAATMDDLILLPRHIREPVQQCLDPEPTERPAARAVVQSLLGDGSLPAGVLAEGARRAARFTARGRHDQFQPDESPASGPHLAGQRPQDDAYHGARSPGGRPHSGWEGRGHGDRPAGATGSRHSQGAAPADQRSRARSGARSTSRARAGLGRRAGWLIGAAVVIAAAAAVVIHLAQGTNGPSTVSQHSPTPGHTAKKSRSPSPSPSQRPSTPAAFAGSWAGLVRQPPIDTYHVTVRLARGTSPGTISYSATSFSCSGALNLVTATKTVLTMSQGIIQGQSKCENGQVTITLTSANTIQFSFRSSSPGAPGASGTLTRR